jgi:hypothetical protein
MPHIKNRTSQPDIDREQRFQRALKALNDGVFISIGEAATTFNLPKSSLGHRRNGRQTRQKSREGDQILSPAAEKAVVKWILKLDDCGFPPRLDRLW